MTQLLLPPAPPEIERYELAKEKFASLDSSALRRIESFSRAIEPLMDALKQMCEAFASMPDFLPIALRRPDLIESMTRYALAGHPFGKSHKGRKRWERRQRIEKRLSR